MDRDSTGLSLHTAPVRPTVPAMLVDFIRYPILTKLAFALFDIGAFKAFKADGLFLDGQQTVKKRTIALERDAKVFGGDVVAAVPLVFEF